MLKVKFLTMMRNDPDSKKESELNNKLVELQPTGCVVKNIIYNRDNNGHITGTIIEYDDRKPVEFLD